MRNTDDPRVTQHDAHRAIVVAPRARFILDSPILGSFPQIAYRRNSNMWNCAQAAARAFLCA
jgi:hypothetical protein